MIIHNNTRLKKVDFESERELQTYIEGILEEAFNLKFVTREFIVGKYRIDTVAYDPESKSFKIIEYKNVRNMSLVDQGLAYLRVLHDRKADFVLKYNELNTSSLLLKDIDWTQSSVIFISTHFTDYQLDGTAFKDFPFSLLKVTRYEGNTVLIEEKTKSSTISFQSNIDNESNKTLKEFVVYSEEDHLKNKPEHLIDLYYDIRSEMLELGDIKIEARKQTIAFKGSKNIIDIEIQKNQLKIHINLKKGELIDPKQITFDQFGIGHWGNGDYRIAVTDFNDKEYLMYLFKQSFDINK